MGFGTAIATCMSKFVTFRGRASRSEYWYFYLFCVLCIAGAVILDLALGTDVQDEDGAFAGGLAFWLTVLVLMLPLLSVLIRRLHDTDRSGWWYWIGLIPLVGAILLLVWTCTRGTSGTNRFGPDSLDPHQVAVFE